jgi:hypothetical protein
MVPTLDSVSEAALAALPLQLDTFLIGKGWVCTTTAGMLIESRGNAHDLPLEMRMFAVELCERLNREIALDGRWAVGWTDFSPSDGFPKRAFMAFLDQDGDLILIIDIEDPFLIMVGSADDYLDQAAEAHGRAQGHLADVGVKPDQRIKAALGEPSRDPTAEADWVTDRI